MSSSGVPVQLLRRTLLTAICALLIPAGVAFAEDKRGPKPKGTGLHNEKVEEIIRREKAKGLEHIGGGTERKEVTIELEKGAGKSSRRADATFRTPDTQLTAHHQVGLTDAKGQPVKREREALDDIRNHARDAKDRNVIFHPYTPPKKK